MIPTTIFITFTAFALITSAAPGVSISSRGAPEPLGKDANYRWTTLIFTTYSEPNCKGDSQKFQGDGAYGDFMACQMMSYYLNRHLDTYEQLDFFTGDGPDRYSTDLTMNGNIAASCLQYDVTAGINATTHDDQGHGTHNGCHTLHNNEACANIWLTNDA